MDAILPEERKGDVNTFQTKTGGLFGIFGFIQWNRRL